MESMSSVVDASDALLEPGSEPDLAGQAGFVVDPDSENRKETLVR